MSHKWVWVPLLFLIFLVWPLDSDASAITVVGQALGIAVTATAIFAVGMHLTQRNKAHS